MRESKFGPPKRIPFHTGTDLEITEFAKKLRQDQFCRKCFYCVKNETFSSIEARRCSFIYISFVPLLIHDSWFRVPVFRFSRQFSFRDRASERNRRKYSVMHKLLVRRSSNPILRSGRNVLRKRNYRAPVRSKQKNSTMQVIIRVKIRGLISMH